MKRIVTGHTQNGKSIFVSEAEPSQVVTLENWHGLALIELWATDSSPTLPVDQSEPTVGMSSFVPGPGGTRFRIVQFPSAPEAQQASESRADPEAIRQEALAKLPGLAETFEEDLVTHTTDTVDYGIVLSGEIWLELDDSAEVHLKPGDCVVQNGTRHAWKNRGAEPCVIAFIMIGARREGSSFKEDAWLTS